MRMRSGVRLRLCLELSLETRGLFSGQNLRVAETIKQFDQAQASRWRLESGSGRSAQISAPPDRKSVV